jgi:formate dehydrogenase subunit gamma
MLTLLTVFILLANIGFLLADVTLPDSEVGLRQMNQHRQILPATQYFLSMRDSRMIPTFGIAMIVFVAISLAHFFTFGPKDMSTADEKDLIPWWTLTERILHWVVAVAFVILGVSGLWITYGRTLGGGGGALVLRMAHEYAGLIFTPALLIMIAIWLRNAMFRAYDMEWMKHLGGYVGYKGKIVSGKFNAGQKFWYWVMTVCGVILMLTGLAVYLNWGDVTDARVFMVIHLYAAMPILLMFLVHLYMSTLGTKGTLMSMFHGRFSKTAAGKFHSDAANLKA